MARDLIREAHHEAGHAVVFHCLDRRIDYVQIGQDSKCVPLGKWGDSPEDLEDAICAHLSGPAADRLDLGDDLPNGDALPGWERDVQAARYNADRLAGQSGVTKTDQRYGVVVSQILTTQRERADSYVRTAWPAVVAVADALLDRQLLTGREVYDIIDRELNH